MTKEEMAMLFKREDNDPLHAFRDLVLTKYSNRKDLHAFLLLESLDSNSDTRAIAAAEHDEIWLGFDEDKVAAVITEEQIIELRRCGVHYSDDGMGFHMFA